MIQTKITLILSWHHFWFNKSIPSFFNLNILKSVHQQKIVPAEILKFGHL